jgi:hypothetical protein
MEGVGKQAQQHVHGIGSEQSERERGLNTIPRFGFLTLVAVNCDRPYSVKAEP